MKPILLICIALLMGCAPQDSQKQNLYSNPTNAPYASYLAMYNDDFDAWRNTLSTNITQKYTDDELQELFRNIPPFDVEQSKWNFSIKCEEEYSTKKLKPDYQLVNFWVTPEVGLTGPNTIVVHLENGDWKISDSFDAFLDDK